MRNLSKEEYLKIAKDYAISRGGVCLSEEYVDNSVKIYWRCSKSEYSEWCSSYDHIVGRMQWCRE